MERFPKQSRPTAGIENRICLFRDVAPGHTSSERWQPVTIVAEITIIIARPPIIAIGQLTMIRCAVDRFEPNAFLVIAHCFRPSQLVGCARRGAPDHIQHHSCVTRAAKHHKKIIGDACGNTHDIAMKRFQFFRAVRYAVLCQLVAVAAIFIAATSSAHAACNSAPEARVDWSGCIKARKMLSELNLTGARFERASLVSSDLHNAVMDNAVLESADLSRARLSGASLRGANLAKAAAYRTLFDSANMSGADLTKGEFFRSSFRGARLESARLDKGEFPRADFTRADLSGGTFVNANISRATFARSNLGNASFRNAYTYRTDFSDADLWAVLDLTQAQVDVACGNAATILPSGLTAPANWPCGDE